MHRSNSITAGVDVDGGDGDDDFLGK